MSDNKALHRINKYPEFKCILEKPIEENTFQTLGIDITYRCNMDCNFCWNPARKIPDMKLEFFEEACRRLPNKVQWKFLGGEPTLHKDLFDFIRVANKYGHSVYISSNGIKYTDKLFMDGLKQLKHENMKFVLGLSMDGGYSDEDVYEKITGRKCLDQKLSALHALIEANVARVMLSAIVVRDLNEHVIAELLELAENNSSVIRFVHFRNVGQEGIIEDTKPYTMGELKDIISSFYTKDKFKEKCVGEIHCHPDNSPGCCYRFRPSKRVQISIIESGSDRANRCPNKGYLSFDKFVVHSFYDNIIQSNAKFMEIAGIPIIPK